MLCLGPCHPSAYPPPTALPAHCLPSNCRGLLTVLWPTRHVPPPLSLLFLPVDMYTVPSLQLSVQTSLTKRFSLAFPYKKQQQSPPPNLHSHPPTVFIYPSGHHMTICIQCFLASLPSRMQAPWGLSAIHLVSRTRPGI